MRANVELLENIYSNLLVKEYREIYFGYLKMYFTMFLLKIKQKHAVFYFEYKLGSYELKKLEIKKESVEHLSSSPLDEVTSFLKLFNYLPDDSIVVKVI